MKLRRWLDHYNKQTTHFYPISAKSCEVGVAVGSWLLIICTVYITKCFPKPTTVTRSFEQILVIHVAKASSELSSYLFPVLKVMMMMLFFQFQTWHLTLLKSRWGNRPTNETFCPRWTDRSPLFSLNKGQTDKQVEGPKCTTHKLLNKSFNKVKTRTMRSKQGTYMNHSQLKISARQEKSTQEITKSYLTNQRHKVHKWETQENRSWTGNMNERIGKSDTNQRTCNRQTNEPVNNKMSSTTNQQHMKEVLVMTAGASDWHTKQEVMSHTLDKTRRAKLSQLLAAYNYGYRQKCMKTNVLNILVFEWKKLHCPKTRPNLFPHINQYIKSETVHDSVYSLCVMVHFRLCLLFCCYLDLCFHSNGNKNRKQQESFYSASQ